MYIISKNVRIRCPDYFNIGNYSIVDDFCYFSTKVELGINCHIASNCTVAGGIDTLFKCGNYGGLASGVRVYCASDNFKEDLACVLPKELNYIKNNVIKGDVILENYVTIGANSVVMPNNYIPEGTVVGALSLVPVNFKFDPWTVYAGYPKLRKIGERNKENILNQIKKIMEYYENN